MVRANGLVGRGHLKWSLRLLAILAVFAVLAAACGSDDEGAGSDANGTAEAGDDAETEAEPSTDDDSDGTATDDDSDGAPGTAEAGDDAETEAEPSTDDDSDGTATDDDGDGAPLEVSGPVELTMWQHSFPPMNEWTEGQIAEFEAANPDISVNLEIIPFPDWDTKLLSALATGQAPNFFQGDTFLITLLIDSGAAAPLDPRLFGSETLDELQASFSDGALSPYIRDGELFAVPYSAASDVLVYNIDLLAAAGIDPASLTTWEAVLDAGETLTVRDGDGNMVQSGFSLIHNNNAYYTRELGTLFLQTGASVVNESATEATLNTPEAREVLQFWYDAVHTYGASSPSFTTTFLTEDFIAGNIGIAWMSVWANQLLGRQGLVYGEDYGIILPPSLNAENTDYLSYGWNWVANSANSVDEGIATTLLIDHLSRAGASFFETAGQFSPREGWREEVSAETLAPYAEILESLDRAKPPAPLVQFNELWKPVIDAIAEIETNPDADIDELLARAQEQVTAVLFR